jgi:L-lactate dehydrogenase complex protein LldE
MGTIRTHYPELFREDPHWLSRVQALSAKSYELVSFLVDVMGIQAVQASYSGSVTYHDSCSGLRELQIRQQPRQLLKSVQGLELNEMHESEVCCGFGGTFCVKYPEISTRLVSDKVEQIDKTAADTVLGGDLGCLLNICGRLRRLDKDIRVYHVAEVLADMADIPGIGEPER